MLKVAKTLELKDAQEIQSAAILSEEWKPEENNKENKVCECEARVRAYMRMLRVGEGTGEKVKAYDKNKKIIYINKNFEDGYTTAFNGNKITDLNKHPEKNYGGSTAAGAYQVMRYTWWDFNGHVLKDKKKTGVYKESKDFAKKYGINDYQPESQDKFCLALMRYNNKLLL
jgi:muramidase (phage lysozyme)